MLSALAPARRRLVLGVLAVALVGALVAGALLVTGRERGPLAAAAPPDQPGPVLLVPGYGGATASLTGLTRRLRAGGREVRVVSLPGGGLGDLREQADALDEAARAELARTGAPSVDVVGYSAGGVVARLWAADDGRAVARRVVTLGSPHHGTEVAALGASLAPDQCPLACRQLVPDSDLLRELNTDETPDGPIWVSVWTTLDQVVTPADSARLDGALNIRVQDVCPRSQVEHAGLPTDPVVLTLVVAALAPPPPKPPTRADCLGS